MAMTVKKAAIPPTEAAKLVARLQKRGMTSEEIAFKLRVSLNSIVRWRKGVVPHPGHMTSLRDLAKKTA
jgi:transcriptional regulator with XRE-family HTH domain